MTSAELLVLPVGAIMSRWPSTISVFIARRMHCIGCPVSMFHRLEDAAAEHGLELEELLQAVEAAVNEAAEDAPVPGHQP